MKGKSKKMNETAKNWVNEAWKLEEAPARLPRPFDVLSGEAVELARICLRHWEPALGETGQVIEPGLKSAVQVGGHFSATAPQDLIEITDALQAAQTEYRLLVDSPRVAPTERGQFLLSEIRATLQWLFDDGNDDVSDAQLVALGEAHDDALSQDAVAAALYDYAALAERHSARLQNLGGFDVANIPEAREVAQALREHSGGPTKRPAEPGVDAALELRNRLGSLLHHKVLTARAAMRFVFRHHPKIARQAGSAYERKARARRRNARSDAPVSGVSGSDDTQLPAGSVLG